MIHMPRRSVTRFFIPLIDVLILLFCIFLLLEYNSEAKYNEQSIDVEYQALDEKQNIDALAGVTKELLALKEKLQQLEDLNPQAADLLRAREEMEKLKKEIERLKSIKLQDRAAFRIIDIKSTDGTISWYDENNPDQPYAIPDAKAAQSLIDKHAQEAKGREVYYYFMPPRPLKGYPTAGQNKMYKAWFARAANSLAESR